MFSEFEYSELPIAMLAVFSVILDILDKCVDGILGIECKNRFTDYKIVIFVCYLPPENSPWGRNPDLFFTHLLNQIYLLHDYDQLYIAGDFNSKIGEMNDYLDGDMIYNRKVIDKCKNSHGDSLIDFLRDSKLCVMNGRINNQNDDFTFVSTRGKSVIDYIITQHDNLDVCKTVYVLECS